MRLTRFIVIAMEKLCGWLDNVPVPDKADDGWHFYKGALGCYWLNLSERSLRLDERWGTGVWTGPS